MAESYASLTKGYLLWFFFGIFGAHRFYLGRWQSGLVWLLTAGLCGIGWLIDLFLVGEFVEQYNKALFHKQMMETGASLLYAPGEYPAGMAAGGYLPVYSQNVYMASGAGNNAGRPSYSAGAGYEGAYY